MKAAALFVLLALTGCGAHPCEEAIDCVIRCQCPGMNGDLTVGPYACRAGRCDPAFDRDLDCERPCTSAWSAPNLDDGDDDSAR